MRILKTFFLGYLKFFARLKIQRDKPLVIGVGGSSGKSSVSLLISLILAKNNSVKESKGKNSETGIPLNILDIEVEDYSYLFWLKVFLTAPIKAFSKKSYGVYVAEMGIDSPYPPKNMEYLLKIIQPDIGVLTAIDAEHSENFDPLVSQREPEERKEALMDLIRGQEELLVKSIPEQGFAIFNIDDSQIKKISKLRSKSLTVSSKSVEADLFIKEIKTQIDSFELSFIYMKKEYKLKIGQALPDYFAHSFGLCIAASFAAGTDIKEAIEILQSEFKLPPGRLRIFDGIKGSKIIDSSYNSSFEPLVGILRMMGKIPAKRKVAILGDMREQGSISQGIHEEMAREIMKNVDFAMLIGPMSVQFAAPVLEKANFKYKAFKTFQEAKDEIKPEIKENDLVLVKGSQNTLYLERAVEVLLENPKDVSFLCRRGEYWDKRREAV